MADWQPIETAPRDANPVLAYTPFDDTCGCTRVLSYAHGAWLSWPGPFEYEPTHWQPLPEPPSQP